MPLRVRYVECDMQGRAFNGHYLTWVDMALNEAIRAIFGDYQVLIDRGIDFVVTFEKQPWPDWFRKRLAETG